MGFFPPGKTRRGEKGTSRDEGGSAGTSTAIIFVALAKGGVRKGGHDRLVVVSDVRRDDQTEVTHTIDGSFCRAVGDVG